MSAISPADHATNFIAPTLLIHAENDQVVKINQSEQMLDALQSAKKDVKFVELKNENHNLSTLTGRAKTLEEIVTFMHTRLSQEKS
jgi:dipeptidyl aminopeptidase/acylaminoacyl peptidase